MATALDRLQNNPACHNRRRRAALRDGVESAPLHLFRSAPLRPSPLDRQLTYSFGTLPASSGEAVELINQLRGADDLDLLTEQDIYIHYAEAANNRFIGDRFMFLDPSTLQNIAGSSEAGFAFMNNHATGGMSSPSELPFGYTFSGRYEEHGEGPDTFRRTVLGVYMMRGHHPNGTKGPSTDDLHKGIRGGTLRDVSMGLMGGMRVCDVCGVDLEERDPEDGRYVCRHVPGTHERMSEEEIEAQRERGAKDGVATYSLVDGGPREVSAVFKGAVPGAGFRKMLSLGAAGMTPAARREVLSAYGPLLTAGERLSFGGGAGRPIPGHNSGGRKMTFRDLLTRIGGGGEVDLEQEIEIDLQGAGPSGGGGVNRGSSPPPAPPAETSGARMGVPLPDDVDKRLRAVELRTAKADARDWLLSLKGKVTPFERGQLETAYLLAHMDDVDRPATHPVTGEQVKRTDLLMLANQHRAPSPLMPQPGSEGKPPADLIGSEPILQEGEKVLPANSPAPTEELKRLETTMEILAATEGGRIILREKFGEQGEAYLRRYDSDPKRQIAQGLF